MTAPLSSITLIDESGAVINHRSAFAKSTGYRM
jgi:hypothetical protein